ncbi:MAG: hypothetical protein L3J92_06325 [Thermoplasmata archaeon]|jgi:predicted RNA-binding Zn-ribbon protein involved in translation (DUF1610 family)|nr:hypothetical protein [Thermoplasmata archaeon]
MRRRHRGRRILVCPQCNSSQIVQANASITGAVYRCLKCDYLGALVLEIEVDDTGKPLR